jgi:3-dehydroquinate synthase II
MKKIWFHLHAWDKKLVTTVLEVGFDALLVPEDCIEKVRSLARIPLISTSSKADFVLGKDVMIVLIDNKSKEKEVIKHQGKIPVIIQNMDWTIIPLENLLSKTNNIFQTVTTAAEAKIALQTLEKGADGIVVDTIDKEEIRTIGKLFHGSQHDIVQLQEATIESILPVGLGDRVILDTSSLLAPGKGMLIGNSSSAFFLVFNENVESPYADPRPFRVNAGGVHAYVMMPDNTTKYLCEVKSGLSALCVDPKGVTEPVIIGRVKIERRPMLQVTAKAGDRLITLVVQNAETIRLTSPAGKPLSVTHIQKGDAVLVHLGMRKAGRHFGHQILETITEQ